MTVALIEDQMSNDAQADGNSAKVDEKTDAEVLQEESELFVEYVGTFLRMERRRLKMTQDQVAEKVGRSKGWVSHVENGQNDSSSSAKLYALAINVDYAYIVALAENALDTRKRQHAQ